MNVYEKLHKNGISLSINDIIDLVKKYDIKEIAIFGSSIRDDFNENSDIDLLIEFNNSENISLFDIIDIQDYFRSITKRQIDIVEPAGLKNPYRRDSILKNKEPLYVA
jgi:predicted nucleotidyltransferase